MIPGTIPPAVEENEGIRDKKLKLAGYSYLLGDGAMYAAAKLRGETLVGNKLAAVAWAAGGLGAALYGNPNTEKQLAIQARKLEQHLNHQGIVIPKSAREQNALLRSPGLWDKIQDFLYEHPSEILNAGYAIGAAALIKGAIPTLGKTSRLLPGKEMSSEFWMGVLVLGGALGGLLIKEDKNAHEHAKESGVLSKVKAYFQEKPLRWSGTLYTLNNGFLAHRAWKDISQRGKYQSLQPYYFSSLQLATYLFSNFLLSHSARDQMEGNGLDGHGLVQLEDAAARVIAAQPVEVQQTLLADVSHYLAEQKNIGQPAPQLAQALANRITELTGERVQQAANDVSWTAREAARASAKSTEHKL